MSSPLTLATAVVDVTGARPSNPDVSASRNPPTKRTTIIIQMYFAEARIACSKAQLLRKWRIALYDRGLSDLDASRATGRNDASFSLPHLSVKREFATDQR